MTFTDTAIVLFRRPFREHDRIYTLLTRMHGKIEAAAHGTRKKLSKLAGHLEPYREIEVMIAGGRRLQKIAQVAPVRAFLPQDPALSQVAAAGCISEAVDRTIVPNHRDTALFSLVENAFASAGRNADPSFARIAVGRFFIQLLRHLGYAPTVEHCVRCRLKTPSPFEGEGWGEGWSLSAFRGGLICAECRISEPPDSAIALTPGAIDLVRADRAADIARSSPSDANLLFRSAANFLEYRLEYPPKSFSVFAHIAQKQ